MPRKAARKILNRLAVCDKLLERLTNFAADLKSSTPILNKYRCRRVIRNGDKYRVVEPR